jgi:hypothetical protein
MSLTTLPLQAKIVAMTCTHAALKRREFIDLAFKYDNLLMEEAGQILEIETFIPLLLQVGGVRGSTGARVGKRCKRYRDTCSQGGTAQVARGASVHQGRG